MKKYYLAGLILAVISLVLVLWAIHTEIFQTLELRFLDYRFRWRPAHKANSNIVIVAIDDGSINTIGRWPWSRKVHAGLLKILSDYPPKAIGFDILFTEPEGEPREGDTALAHYSRLLGNVVYAGYIREIDNEKCLPIEELTHTGKVGFINVPPDKDGIIRKVPLVIKHNESILPSFTLQVLCTYLNVDYKDVEINLGGNITIPQIGDIPIDEKGYMWINYVGAQEVFKETAFIQALGWSGTERFSNTLLLIGLTATGLGDQGHIPIATNVPLISVQANALNTILNKDFIIKAPDWMGLVIIVTCVLLSVIINLFFRPMKAGLLSLLLIVLFVTVNLWLFQKNVWVDILGPSLGFVVPFLLITVYRYGWEERQRRWIKKVFTHYLSKDVIDAVLREPQKLKLGGELKTATVLYLDLRNFSTYCESRSPAEVVGFLNQSFDWMTEVILRHGGMLDKYIGDAIMAIFGTPLETHLTKQAEEAVLTAIEIVEKWYKLPLDTRCQLDIGIGINTGPMLIGNIGSRYIFNYTAIGDEVNIAARVQGLTGEYKVNIIITDPVYILIKDRFKTESLGEVAVKGRKGVVKIYNVTKQDTLKK